MAAKKEAPEVGANENIDDILVPLFIPSIPGKKGQINDVLLTVNGESILVQRGKTVMVKRKFYEVYRNSEREAAVANDYEANNSMQ